LWLTPLPLLRVTALLVRLNGGYETGQIVDKRQTEIYHSYMKHLRWNVEKNELLKQMRGISFAEIAYLIENGKLLGIEKNPGYPNQKIYIVEVDNYAIVVPFVETDTEIFLKTAFPSRKYSKRYGLKGE
jgi:hypothetical protein